MAFECVRKQLSSCIVACLFMPFAATSCSAQNLRTQAVSLEEIGELRIIQAALEGDEILDYRVVGERSQILSVDLLTSNSANYFNISRAGENEAIFIGSTRGNVADVPLPESGAYDIRVHLMRSAARRGETARFSMALSIGAPEFADSLSGGPDYWKVSGVQGDDALDLRAGPAGRYDAVGKLGNGEIAQNRGCRLTGRERWCQVRAAHSGATGWVAGRYLVESAAPPSATVAEDGPVGNGVPFDATGMVPCATATGQPMRQCPFGVVREGPGNAGVWIATGNGDERHFLFEGGTPVATSPADTLEFEKSGDLFILRVADERFEIPEAVVNGG